MKILVAFLNSSIGKKWIVALTGLVMVGFVIVHMLGNLQILWPHGAGQEHLNAYAKKLHDLGLLLWAARLFLLACLIAHVYFTVSLVRANRAARPERYAKPARIVASVPMLTMIISGLILLAFIAFHLAHFTLHWVKPEYGSFVDGQGRPDVYSMVVRGFQSYVI